MADYEYDLHGKIIESLSVKEKIELEQQRINKTVTDAGGKIAGGMITIAGHPGKISSTSPILQPLKDGGTRKTYSTGAQKEDSTKCGGKGAYHLLPTYPIRRLAEIYRKGAIKYEDRNWEKGIPLSRFIDSAKRHLDKYAEGMLDEEHCAQALWNVAGLIHTAEMIKRGLLPEELDDLPSYGIDGVAIEVEDGVFCDKWRKPGKGSDQYRIEQEEKKKKNG